MVSIGVQPTIDQFDFNHHISRKNLKNTILGLLDLEFIRKKMDIILIGNPGVGKSFLAKTIAYAATQAGIATLERIGDYYHQSGFRGLDPGIRRPCHDGSLLGSTDPPRPYRQLPVG